MQFIDAADVILQLLKVRTYTELRGVEERIREQGILIKDDFIWTEERRAAVDGISDQFARGMGATAILIGWYGAGKTAVLQEVLRRLRSTELKYDRRLLVDPVEMRLNEENIAGTFL